MERNSEYYVRLVNLLSIWAWKIIKRPLNWRLFFLPFLEYSFMTAKNYINLRITVQLRYQRLTRWTNACWRFPHHFTQQNYILHCTLQKAYSSSLWVVHILCHKNAFDTKWKNAGRSWTEGYRTQLWRGEIWCINP